jgi:hypothetical protein
MPTPVLRKKGVRNKVSVKQEVKEDPLETSLLCLPSILNQPGNDHTTKTFPGCVF